MAGEVRANITIKGKRVRLRETFADGDRVSFKAALDKTTSEEIRLRKSAIAEAKARPTGFRKKKAPKNA